MHGDDPPGATRHVGLGQAATPRAVETLPAPGRLPRIIPKGPDAGAVIRGRQPPDAGASGSGPSASSRHEISRDDDARDRRRRRDAGEKQRHLDAPDCAPRLRPAPAPARTRRRSRERHQPRAARASSERAPRPAGASNPRHLEQQTERSFRAADISRADALRRQLCVRPARRRRRNLTARRPSRALATPSSSSGATSSISPSCGFPSAPAALAPR